MQRSEGTRGRGRLDRARLESRRAADGLARMRRWMGDRLEWLLEEEDDWQEPWQRGGSPPQESPRPPLQQPSRPPSPDEPRRRLGSPRRRLEAISRRQQPPDAPTPGKFRGDGQADVNQSPPSSLGREDWPEDDAFRVPRWSPPAPSAAQGRRPPPPERRSRAAQPSSSDPATDGRRPVPRSSRRRFCP